jgi:hypothetical protein
MYEGSIKTIVEPRGFGFIQCANFDKDVFFHATGLAPGIQFGPQIVELRPCVWHCGRRARSHARNRREETMTEAEITKLKTMLWDSTVAILKAKKQWREAIVYGIKLTDGPMD